MIYFALGFGVLLAALAARQHAKMRDQRKKAAESLAQEKEFREHCDSVNALTVSEARELVLTILKDETRFRSVPAITPLGPEFDALAPELHAFFSEWECVKTVPNDMFVICRDLFRPVDSKSRHFWHIGREYFYGDVLAKTGEEEIYETDDYDFIFDGEPVRERNVRARTIYHWIILNFPDAEAVATRVVNDDAQYPVHQGREYRCCRH